MKRLSLIALILLLCMLGVSRESHAQNVTYTTVTAGQVNGFYYVDNANYTTIHAALTAACSATPQGGTIFVAPGSYPENTVLSVANGTWCNSITLIGSGSGQCDSVTPPTMITTTSTTAHLIDATGANDWVIFNVCLKNTSAGSTGAAINLSSTQRASGMNIYISGPFSNGLRFFSSSGSASSTIWNNFTNVHCTGLSANGIGVLFDSSDAVAKVINNNNLEQDHCTGGTGGVALKFTNSSQINTHAQVINENKINCSECSATGGTGILFDPYSSKDTILIGTNAEGSTTCFNKAAGNTVVLIGGNISSCGSAVVDAQPQFTTFLNSSVQSIVQQFGLTPLGGMYLDSLGLHGAAPATGVLNMPSGDCLGTVGSCRLTINTSDPQVVDRSQQTAQINNKIYVGNSTYAASATGLQSAITDAQSNGSREIYLPCGTTNINATITVTHGGFRFIGCGAGLNDSASSPTTLMQWTGAAGSDMISVLGTISNRLDPVMFENMILDGGGTARYTLRMEKIDDAILRNVRIRQGATAGLYNVDATGLKLREVQFSQCPSYCLVSDWATGGFSWVGGNVDVLVANSNPAVLVQGAVNGWHVTNVEFDASETGAFAGYIQINGFDTNSSFASAPSGGAGAPSLVDITGSTFFQHSGALTPSQGADVLITGTATNKSTKIILERLQFSGLSISAGSVKIDNATQVELKSIQSSGHTASTLIRTANPTFISEYLLLSTDPAICTGTGCGNELTFIQAGAGQLTLGGALQIGGFFSLPEIAAPTCASGFDLLWGDSTAHRTKECDNNGSSVQIVHAGADINNSDQVTVTHLSSPLPKAQALGATVYTDQANTFGAFTQDFSGTTLFKTRVGATLTTSVNGDIGYDTTNKNWHIWDNGIDSFMGVFAASPTNGDCLKASVVSGIITIADSGTPCDTAAGTVTSIATNSPIGGGTITGSGTITCTTCVTSAASLTNNQLMFGAGGQASAIGDLSGDVTTAGGKATTVAKIAGVTVSGTTGTINSVFSNSPTIVTPTISTSLTIGSMIEQNDTGRFGAFAMRFIPSSGNNAGAITLMPSGSSTESDLRLYNASDASNTGSVDIDLIGTTLTFTPLNWGTGTAPTGVTIASSLTFRATAPIFSGATSLATFTSSGLATNYNGINTTGNGFPAEYSTPIDLTAQSAAITSTLVYAVPASGAGNYKVCHVATVTTAASTSSALGGTNGFQITYTDNDTNVVKTVPGTPVAGLDTNTSNSTSTGTVSSCVIVNAKASTNINYKMDYTSVGITAMRFNLHIPPIQKL